MIQLRNSSWQWSLSLQHSHSNNLITPTPNHPQVHALLLRPKAQLTVVSGSAAAPTIQRFDALKPKMTLKSGKTASASAGSGKREREDKDMVGDGLVCFSCFCSLFRITSFKGSIFA